MKVRRRKSEARRKKRKRKGNRELKSNEQKRRYCCWKFIEVPLCGKLWCLLYFCLDVDPEFKINVDNDDGKDKNMG